VKTNKKKIIFGRHPILEALEDYQKIDKIYLKKNVKGEFYEKLYKLANEQNIPIQTVPVEKLNRITMKNHQGVIAEVGLISYSNVEDVLSVAYDSGKLPLFLILDKVSDVRNFVAIVRTALCMGVHAVIIPKKGSANINEEAVKASAGAILKMPICRVDSLEKTLDYFKSVGVSIVGADLTGSEYFHEISLAVPLAVVMGSEGAGLELGVMRRVDYLVKLPMMGKFDSLNVSVATGMILYEVVRQKFLNPS